MKNIGEEIKQTRPFRDVYHKASVNLIYTGKWIIKRHDEVFRSVNLSVQQYNILRILKGIHPRPVTVKYIRERMLDKMSDASRIVETMHRKGLLERTQRKTDRRKVDVTLTKEGLTLLEKIAHMHDILYGFLSNLDEKEAEQLNFLLDKARG